MKSLILTCTLLLSACPREPVPGWTGAYFAGELPPRTTAEDVGSAFDCVDDEMDDDLRVASQLGVQTVIFQKVVFDEINQAERAGTWDRAHTIRIATEGRDGLSRTAIYHELFRVAHAAVTHVVIEDSLEHAYEYEQRIQRCKDRGE